MDQIILFNKSYLQRLNEFLDVLSSQEILPASQVKKEWSYYLEMLLERTGWQAIWKIPRLLCQKYKISYPTIVLVYVQNVDYETLTAEIKVLAVQNDIVLPEHHCANLIQLWPTQYQDDTVCLDIRSIANCLDMLRFFYANIWRPWDLDDSNTGNWLAEHLETRLRLYFDMKMDIVPRNMSEKIRALVLEARNLGLKLEALEEEYSSEDSDTENKPSANDANAIGSVDRISKHHIRMMKIKTEIDIMENSQLRAYQMRQQAIQKKLEAEHWIVFQSGLSASSYIEYLLGIGNDVKAFQTAVSLQNALNAAAPNDVVILGPGRHRVESMRALEQGGILKGLPNNQLNTILETTNEDIMLDFFAKSIQLEHLSIEGGKVDSTITIRYGSLHLKNCQLSGCNGTSTQQGILVLAESELIMEDCHLSGFATGIFASANSRVKLENCSFEATGTALKVFDKSALTINGCKFHNCNEYAVYMETEDEQTQKKQIGGAALLEGLPNFQATNCVFDSNRLGDVAIYQKSDLFPIRDLFSNPSFNTTIMPMSYENIE